MNPRAVDSGHVFHKSLGNGLELALAVFLLLSKVDLGKPVESIDLEFEALGHAFDPRRAVVTQKTLGHDPQIHAALVHRARDAQLGVHFVHAELSNGAFDPEDAGKPKALKMPSKAILAKILSFEFDSHDEGDVFRAVFLIQVVPTVEAEKVAVGVDRMLEGDEHAGLLREGPTIDLDGARLAPLMVVMVTPNREEKGSEYRQLK